MTAIGECEDGAFDEANIIMVSPLSRISLYLRIQAISGHLCPVFI
jgi:hypothetical protein